jgi:hypothetical protein
MRSSAPGPPSAHGSLRVDPGDEARAPTIPGLLRRFARRNDESSTRSLLAPRRKSAGGGIRPNKSKQTLAAPNKTKQNSLVLFVRIVTFQWVTENPNKNFAPPLSLCARRPKRTECPKRSLSFLAAGAAAPHPVKWKSILRHSIFTKQLYSPSRLRAYFASEALWTYLTSPFLYTYPAPRAKRSSHGMRMERNGAA